MDSAAVATMLKGHAAPTSPSPWFAKAHARPLVFDLVRDEIPRPSVDLAFLISPGVGYIHVSSFIETTSHEVGDALDKFGDIHGLVLDLRGNPGGLLNEAVNMSDKFLQKGQIVVSQRGRAFPDQVYRATRGEEGPKFPIVVLVNRNTASAAEIVSGALQDHDRALIVGETTFGKGLVQTVFQITENTGLALTTYHYYTPSGRLIQRNYDHVSLYDYYYVRDDSAKAEGQEPISRSNSPTPAAPSTAAAASPPMRRSTTSSPITSRTVSSSNTPSSTSASTTSPATPSPRTSRLTMRSCSSSRLS